MMRLHISSGSFDQADCGAKRALSRVAMLDAGCVAAIL
jgi:hypothetical protein